MSASIFRIILLFFLDQSRSKLEDKARQILLPIAKTVLFCGRQGLALRGHDKSNSILMQTDNNDGNVRALLRFRIDAGDNVLESHRHTCGKNAQHTSPSVQNELIIIVENLSQMKLLLA